MKILLKSLACFLVLILTVPALAGTVKEFSAEMVDVQSGRVVQKLAITPDKIYSESLNAKGQREAVAILRLDQRKMYLFLEETKSYLEFPFNKEKFTTADLTLGMVQTKQEKAGSEKVNGYQADKFKISAKVMGMTNTVYHWMAPEFDPLPIRTEAGGVTMEMRNIKEGRPDAALFEIPQGYTRDKGMEEMMKAMMGAK